MLIPLPSHLNFYRFLFTKRAKAANMEKAVLLISYSRLNVFAIKLRRH